MSGGRPKQDREIIGIDALPVAGPHARNVCTPPWATGKPYRGAQRQAERPFLHLQAP